MIRNKEKRSGARKPKPRTGDESGLFELQADICQALANPKRLHILDLLKDGELSVGDLVKAMGVAKANLSQHLGVMRQKGIVNARREGTTVFYSLARPRITEACAIMRQVLLDGLKEKEQLARRVREDIARKRR